MLFGVVREAVKIVHHDIFVFILNLFPAVSLHAISGELHVVESGPHQAEEIGHVHSSITIVVENVKNDLISIIREFKFLKLFEFIHLLEFFSTQMGLLLLKEDHIVILSKEVFIILIALHHSLGSLFKFFLGRHVRIMHVLGESSW